jgi:hypothetical protein
MVEAASFLLLPAHLSRRYLRRATILQARNLNCQIRDYYSTENFVRMKKDCVENDFLIPCETSAALKVATRRPGKV